MKIITLFLITTLLLLSSNTVSLSSLEWQDNKESKKSKLNWYESASYCEKLTLNNKKDWRLPTIRELQSIVDLYQYKPSIKKQFRFTNTKSFYWSSTVSASNSDNAWHVFYKYGNSYFSQKLKKYSVRCVRKK